MIDDSYTKLLIHGFGADGSTDIIDESGKAVTAVGNAQIDTAQYKFAPSSILFDGTGDFLTLADSADWRLDDGSNSNLWTIDLWVRFAVDPSATNFGLISQGVDTDNFWALYQSLDRLLWQLRSGATNLIQIFPTIAWAADTWYHVALVKNGTSGYMHFINGAQIGATTTDADTIPNFAGSLYLGGVLNASSLNGWLAEVRVSKGIARWTSNFTPPANPYFSLPGAMFWG